MEKLSQVGTPTYEELQFEEVSQKRKAVNIENIAGSLDGSHDKCTFVCWKNGASVVASMGVTTKKKVLNR